MDSLTGKLAVVTGGRLGIGRELVRQLAAHGCSVATCDINPDAVAATAATVWACARPGVAVTGRACDVSDQAQVLRFRDELLEQHEHDYADLVFANAGVFGGASFVKDSPEEWERTFNIIWLGVYYYCARVFLPLLIASGVLVNTSSVSGFWPTAWGWPAGHRLQRREFRHQRPSRSARRRPALQCAAGPGRRGHARCGEHRHRREFTPCPWSAGVGAAPSFQRRRPPPPTVIFCSRIIRCLASPEGSMPCNHPPAPGQARTGRTTAALWLISVSVVFGWASAACVRA